ncbi:uncharacterized protein DS421_13g403890 [Arachis hypogaea]|nr:uncharacterized protein DS421_13g403890 [Arachis hypogaea]
MGYFLMNGGTQEVVFFSVEGMRLKEMEANLTWECSISTRSRLRWAKEGKEKAPNTLQLRNKESN